MELSTTLFIGFLTVVFGLIGVIVRQIGPWRKQITETEERLRTELQLALSTERELHAVERVSMIKRISKLESLLGQERLLHEAERRIDRHKLNNLIQCFDMIVLLIETSPDKAPEIIVKVKELRATQMVAEAEEKSQLLKAQMIAEGLLEEENKKGGTWEES